MLPRRYGESWPPGMGQCQGLIWEEQHREIEGGRPVESGRQSPWLLVRCPISRRACRTVAHAGGQAVEAANLRDEPGALQAFDENIQIIPRDKRVVAFQLFD